MSNVWKKDTETNEEYIERICSTVKPEYGLTWDEVADILNDELDLNFSERTYRRRYEEIVKNKSIESSEPGEILDDLLEIKKERYKLRDEINQVNNLVRLQAREEAMREMAIEAAEKVALVKPLKVPLIEHKFFEDWDREGILAIGDWHYGLIVDEFWNKYSPEICRKRVELLLAKTLEVIKLHHIHTIHVVNLGDMISGRIHLPLRVNSRMDVVTQTMEVSEILADMLTELSKHVVVSYYSVSDNHSRIEPKKAESLQPETFVRIIDWYLKERLKDNQNISFEENKYGDDISTFRVFDHTVSAVHGDKDKLKSVINNLSMYTERPNLILTAHLHHFSADESNCVIRLGNGSLMGLDDYAAGLRVNSKPSQLLIVSSEKNITECVYKIDLD